MEQRWIWKGKIGLARFECLKPPFKGCRTQTDFSVLPNCFFLEKSFWWFSPHTRKKKFVIFDYFHPSNLERLDFQKALRVPVTFIDSLLKELKCPCWGVSNWNGSGHQALWQMSLASMLGGTGSGGCGGPQNLPKSAILNACLLLPCRSPGPGFLSVFQGKPK